MRVKWIKTRIYLLKVGDVTKQNAGLTVNPWRMDLGLIGFMQNEGFQQSTRRFWNMDQWEVTINKWVWGMGMGQYLWFSVCPKNRGFKQANWICPLNAGYGFVMVCPDLLPKYGYLIGKMMLFQSIGWCGSRCFESSWHSPPKKLGLEMGVHEKMWLFWGPQAARVAFFTGAGWWNWGAAAPLATCHLGHQDTFGPQGCCHGSLCGPRPDEGLKSTSQATWIMVNFGETHEKWPKICGFGIYYTL